MEKIKEAEIIEKKENNTKYEEINTENNEKNNILWKYLFVLITIIAIAFLIIIITQKTPDTNTNHTITKETSIEEGIKQIYDATVYIESYKDKKINTSGTGFIYKQNKGKAYILTNHHVVAGNTSLKVMLSDDKEIDAKYIGGDEYLDIAVISINDTNVKQIAKLGSNSNSILGETVFTVGSPVGDEYRGTVTRGIISGKDRLVAVSVSGGTEDYVMKLLQTDAAMNPGNSGGPLCNTKGEVLGMNSLKLVKNEVEGMGFAIPIEDILAHIDTFEKGKTIKRPYLGVSMINLNNKEAMSYYGLSKKVNTKLEKGVVIENIEKGASVEGILEIADIVTKVDRKDIDNMAYFRYELFKHEVGDKVTLTIERKGKLKDVVITLKEKSNK